MKQLLRYFLSWGICFLFGINLVPASVFAAESCDIEITPSSLGAQSLQSVVNRATAGTTICLREGQEQERYPAFTVKDRIGTAQDPIIITSYPGERAIVDKYKGGGNGYASIVITSSRYLEIRDLEITDSDPLNTLHKNCDIFNNRDYCIEVYMKHFNGENGIKLYNSSYVTLENLHIHNHGSIGILTGFLTREDNGVVSYLENYHLRILGNNIHDNGMFGGGYGMYITGAYHLIKGNNSHHGQGHAIRLGNHTSPLNHSIIEGNTLHHMIKPFLSQSCGNGWNICRISSGITMWDGTGNTIRNNLVYETRDYGIRINGTENHIVNNTLYRAGFGNSLKSIHNSHDHLPNTYLNNISIGNPNGAIRPGPNSVCSHLIVGNDSRSYPPCTDVVRQAPHFLDVASFDFRLTTKSPLDVGLPVSPWRDIAGNSITATDILGIARPAGNGWDIGAYEFGGTPSADHTAPGAPRNVRLE